MHQRRATDAPVAIHTAALVGHGHDTDITGEVTAVGEFQAKQNNRRIRRGSPQPPLHRRLIACRKLTLLGSRATASG
jgi:hypothetical protein